MSNYLAFNLNDKARVTLTDQGREALVNYYQRHYQTKEEAGRTCDQLFPTWRTTGVIETQLWCLMGMFGHTMQTPGIGGPFNRMCVEICVDDRYTVTCAECGHAPHKEACKEQAMGGRSLCDCASRHPLL